MLDSEFYSEREIDLVWTKAQRISQSHEYLGLRKDACGAIIRRMEYGNRHSVMGWEIGLIVPQAAGGANLLFNLRPLQWQNFEASGAGTLRCVELGPNT